MKRKRFNPYLYEVPSEYMEAREKAHTFQLRNDGFYHMALCKIGKSMDVRY